MKSVGRIAPSPSGHMHLGNAFSAILAWLSARSAGAAFLLRLEDLDERCKGGRYVPGLLEDLRWLGLDWDGEPIFQSQRLAAYERALDEITHHAQVYPCFCTRADLHAASAPHASDGSYVYAGTCYGMPKAEQMRRAKTRPPALRLHVMDRDVSFEDGVMGPYAQNLARECGDFVLRRSDGVFAYQLACVVDDIESGVTEIVRGSDLLSSTPRQLFLYELLGAKAPRYFHHPLLLARDGRRLSKRDADLEIAALRDMGTSPQQIVGYLAALAGLIEPGQKANADELVSVFSWEKVPSGDIVATPPAYLSHLAEPKASKS